MKYNLAVLLLIGAISSSEAIQQQSAGFLQADVVTDGSQEQEKATKKTIQLNKATNKKSTNDKQNKPASAEKIQVKSTMDVKTNNGLIVQVEAIKKPPNANKAQELEAMEEALKKATEEAHRQRLALVGDQELSQNQVESKAFQELKKSQEQQQQALLNQLELEEKQRQLEIKQNEELEKKIAEAEKERQMEETLSVTRASELKKLQEEEAEQKLEAERMEQEFLAAQAIQETKAAAAKKAATKANLARLKRKHELSRRKAEAQLQMLKVKQQMEAEQAMEMEKTRLTEENFQKEQQEKENQIKQAIAQQQQSLQKEEKAKKAADDQKDQQLKSVEDEKKKAQEKKLIEQKQLIEKKKSDESQKKADDKRQKEEAAKFAQQQKEADKVKQQEEIKSKMSEKMTKELDQFSVSLNKKHFDAALQMKNDAKEKGMDDVNMQVHTCDIFKKSFTFPQIAHNDYAVEQFDTLSIAEANLNNDPNNENLYETFVKTSDDVANNLKERYKDQWVDPKDDRNAPTTTLNINLE